MAIVYLRPGASVPEEADADYITIIRQDDGSFAVAGLVMSTGDVSMLLADTAFDTKEAAQEHGIMWAFEAGTETLFVEQPDA